ncbi:MAG: hypothetical protein J6Q22_10950 [Prevotella sp.]|nr:hypothetical protein [Prevotella sp.]
MTFNSVNTDYLENHTTNESLLCQIRVAMGEGCIHPCRVYDLVDEALDRLNKQVELLKRVHDYLGELIKDSLVEDTPKASDLADDVWDTIHKGDTEWRTVHKS